MASSMVRPGVEHPRPVAVAPVGALVGAFAPGGAAQRVGLGRHDLLDEGLDHLADDVVAALVVEVLAQPRQRVHLVGDYHRSSFQDRLAGLPEVAAVVVASGGCSPPGRRAPYPSYTRLRTQTG